MPLKTNEAEIKILVHSQRADDAGNAAERRVSNGLPRARSKRFQRQIRVWRGFAESEFRVFRDVCER